MTPKLPSSAAFVLLAMNYSSKELSAPLLLPFQTVFLSSNSSLPSIHPSIPLLLLAKRAGFSYIILLMKHNSPLAMPAQRPANLTVFQLLRADLSGKGSIRLVKNILAGDLDFLLEVFADKE